VNYAGCGRDEALRLAVERVSRQIADLLDGHQVIAEIVEMKIQTQLCASFRRTVPVIALQHGADGCRSSRWSTEEGTVYVCGNANQVKAGLGHESEFSCKGARWCQNLGVQRQSRID